MTKSLLQSSLLVALACMYSGACRAQCRGTAPALLVAENIVSSADSAVLLGAQARSLNLTPVLRRFGQNDLRCWSDVGDAIADYAIAAKIAKGTEVFSIRFAILNYKKSRAIPYLEKAAKARSCLGLPEEIKLGLNCMSGLPEAQYILSALDRAGFVVSDADGRGVRWLKRAAQQNYQPAIMDLEIINYYKDRR